MLKMLLSEEKENWAGRSREALYGEAESLIKPIVLDLGGELQSGTQEGMSGIEGVPWTWHSTFKFLSRAMKNRVTLAKVSLVDKL